MKIQLTNSLDAILCRHRCHYRRSRCRTWSSHSHDGLHLDLGYYRVLPRRLLGLERQRMVLQVGWTGLRRWRPRRDRIRNVCPRLLDGSGSSPGEDDAEFPPAQRVADHPRYRLPVVRLVGFQRWLRFRCQPSCYRCLLEQQLDCHVRRHDLGSPRLASCPQVVHGRLVLRLHLGTRRCYSRFRFHHPMG